MPPQGLNEGFSAKIVDGRLVVLASRPLDRHEAFGLHTQIVECLRQMAPPEDPNWRRSAARARTSGVDARL